MFTKQKEQKVQTFNAAYNGIEKHWKRLVRNERGRGIVGRGGEMQGDTT